MSTVTSMKDMSVRGRAASNILPKGTSNRTFLKISIPDGTRMVQVLGCGDYGCFCVCGGSDEIVSHNVMSKLLALKILLYLYIPFEIVGILFPPVIKMIFFLDVVRNTATNQKGCERKEVRNEGSTNTQSCDLKTYKYLRIMRTLQE